MKDLSDSEPFFAIKEASLLLNLPYWKVQRAVKDNLIPHYSLLNHKKLVKLSDIIASMKTPLLSSDAFTDGTFSQIESTRDDKADTFSR